MRGWPVCAGQLCAVQMILSTQAMNTSRSLCYWIKKASKQGAQLWWLTNRCSSYTGANKRRMLCVQLWCGGSQGYKPAAVNWAQIADLARSVSLWLAERPSREVCRRNLHSTIVLAEWAVADIDPYLEVFKSPCGVFSLWSEDEWILGSSMFMFNAGAPTHSSEDYSQLVIFMLSMNKYCFNKSCVLNSFFSVTTCLPSLKIQKLEYK